MVLILRQVSVTISPDYKNGPPLAALDYTVQVTNTGEAADNYSLVVNSTGGWRTSITPSSIYLDPGQSGNATLTITVPTGAGGTSMIFYVWAISSGKTWIFPAIAITNIKAQYSMVDNQ
jgi:uncharacterized membrane protein